MREETRYGDIGSCCMSTFSLFLLVEILFLFLFFKFSFRSREESDIIRTTYKSKMRERRTLSDTATRDDSSSIFSTRRRRQTADLGLGDERRKTQP